jgi:hypothetical protein
VTKHGSELNDLLSILERAASALERIADALEVRIASDEPQAKSIDDYLEPYWCSHSDAAMAPNARVASSPLQTPWTGER